MEVKHILIAAVGIILVELGIWSGFDFSGLPMHATAAMENNIISKAALVKEVYRHATEGLTIVIDDKVYWTNCYQLAKGDKVTFLTELTILLDRSQTTCDISLKN